MTMEIEFGSDRNAFADDCANALQDISFAIVIALGGHGAMQRQNHHVYGHGLLQIGQQLVAQFLIGLSDNSPTWLSKGADTLDHWPAPRLGALPPNQKLTRAVVGRPSRDVTMREEAVFKARPACGNRRKGISLGV